MPLLPSSRASDLPVHPRPVRSGSSSSLSSRHHRRRLRPGARRPAPPTLRPHWPAPGSVRIGRSHWPAEPEAGRKSSGGRQERFHLNTLNAYFSLRYSLIKTFLGHSDRQTHKIHYRNNSPRNTNDALYVLKA